MTKPAPIGGFDQLLDASAPEDENISSGVHREATSEFAPLATPGEREHAETRGHNDPRPQGNGSGNGNGNGKKNGNQQMRRDKRDVHGWVILDKPIGMTSTHAVAVIKRLFKAKRAGHAGTLDPLASGGLPIAMGEATKTVPFVMDGRKRYKFTVCWGEERDTDDTEGRATQTDRRGDPRAAAAIHRQHRADPAAILRDQDRRRARL